MIKDFFFKLHFVFSIYVRDYFKVNCFASYFSADISHLLFYSGCGECYSLSIFNDGSNGQNGCSGKLCLNSNAHS